MHEFIYTSKSYMKPNIYSNDIMLSRVLSCIKTSGEKGVKQGSGYIN